MCDGKCVPLQFCYGMVPKKIFGVAKLRKTKTKYNVAKQEWHVFCLAHNNPVTQRSPGRCGGAGGKSKGKWELQQMLEMKKCKKM